MRNKNAKVSDPNSFLTPEGSEIKIEYSPKVMPDGTIQLVESGKYNINDKIQSYADSTDMSYILKQLALGNADVLNVKQGSFGDFTDMPKTYAEALQLKIDAEKSFYQLSPDVRNKFENDFNRYFATAGSDEWYEKLGIVDQKGGEQAPAEEEKAE